MSGMSALGVLLKRCENWLPSWLPSWLPKEFWRWRPASRRLRSSCQEPSDESEPSVPSPAPPPPSAPPSRRRQVPKPATRGLLSMPLSACAVSSTSSGQLKKPGHSTSRKSAGCFAEEVASAAETTLIPSEPSCADSSMCILLWTLVTLIPDAGSSR
eukprot:scaffold142667_cov127-Phaeocystis_antarctica.AAC.2